MTVREAGPPSFDALLFDVDGTLADTEEMHRFAFNATFRLYELPWQWDNEKYAQLLQVAGGKERLLAFIGELDLPPIDQQRLAQAVPTIHASKTQQYLELLKLQNGQLRTGIRRLIAEARAAGVRLGIASTTSRENVDTLLAAAFGGSVSGFDVIVAGDDAPQKKPAPDVYHLALAALGVPADRAIAIEDSAIGLRAAKAAGLFTVVTSNHWTSQQDFTAADIQVASLGDPDHPLEPIDARKIGAPWVGIGQLMALHAAAKQTRPKHRARPCLSELARNVRIISLDLDGTLIDTAPDLAASVNLMLTKLGAPTLAEAQVKALIGNGVDQLVLRALTRSLGAPPQPAMLGAAGDTFGQIYGERLFDRSAVYRGVTEALQEFADRGMALCCTTNKPRRYALPLLEAAGLRPLLTMTFCADDPADRKPAANLLLAACAAASLGPHQMLHVGDSLVDIEAARAAGAGIVAVDYGYCGRETLASYNPDAIVSDLRTLAAVTNRPGAHATSI